MSKPRSLAAIRDLLAVFRRYDEREIAEAITLLESGEAFRELIRLGALVRARLPLTVSKGRGRDKPRIGARSSSRDAFASFLEGLRGRSGDDYAIAELLRGISQRQVLGTGVALREYAKLLGIQTSDSKLDRYVLGKRIGEALLARRGSERKHLLEIARHIGGEPSSLQGWTDIIVKK